MKNMTMKLTKIIAITFIIAGFISCSSFNKVKSGDELAPNEGICIFSFQFLTPGSVQGFSADIIGNNETIELDAEHKKDNYFFIKLKRGSYQLDNIKVSSSLNGGYAARDNPKYITTKRLYFTVFPGKINYLGTISISEVLSSTSANMILRGKNGLAYLNFEISFSQNVWDAFRKKFPEVSLKYKLHRNFIRFKEPKYITRVKFKRNAGLFRGKTSVSYKMTFDRVREVLKEEEKRYDIISTTEIARRGNENSVIKYIFSDNINDVVWRKRLIRVIEITAQPREKIISMLNKKFIKAGENMWKSGFENIELKQQGTELYIIYTAKKYKLR
jgi:hypothetical protein